MSAYTDEQLRMAARLYYVDGLGQTEVARFVKVSQAKISRMLAMARDRGIVRITVAEYEAQNHDLEAELKSAWSLKSAAVIKPLAGADAADTRRAVGHFGAAFASALMPSGSTVAIAGGRTIQELVSALPQEKKQGMTVVQAMGSIDSSVGPVDALELGRVMARLWNGFFLTLNTPAFVPDRKTRDSFMALEQIKHVDQRLSDAGVAVVGVGTPANSVFVERGVLSPADLEKLRGKGAVGEICGRFFDRDGQECDTPWRERVISIGLDQLRRVPQVIAVVAGEDRAEALAAAIRGGLVKSLVIDQAGAEALLRAAS